MAASLFHFIRWNNTNRKSQLLIATVTSILAYLANEAAAVILPLVLLYILLDWREKRNALLDPRRLRQLGLIFLVGLLFVAILLASRFVLGGCLNPNIGLTTANATRNLQFYLGSIFRYFGIFMIIPCLLSFFVRRDSKKVLTLLWATMGVVPVLLMLNTDIRYLIFLSAGLSLFLGVAISDCLRSIGEFRMKAKMPSRSIRRFVLLACMLLVVIGGIQVALADANNLAGLISDRSDASQNVSDALNYIVQRLPENSTVYISRNIAGFTENPEGAMDVLLPMFGRSDIHAKPLDEVSSAGAGNSYVLTEINYGRPLWFTERGATAIYLYSLSQIVQSN